MGDFSNQLIKQVVSNNSHWKSLCERVVKEMIFKFEILEISWNIAISKRSDDWGTCWRRSTRSRSASFQTRVPIVLRTAWTAWRQFLFWSLMMFDILWEDDLAVRTKHAVIDLHLHVAKCCWGIHVWDLKFNTFDLKCQRRGDLHLKKFCNFPPV